MGASRKENAEKLKVLLEGLCHTIGEIKHLEVGINARVAEASPPMADVSLYSEFASWGCLDAYQKHPQYLDVANFVQEIRLDRHVVDYEV